MVSCLLLALWPLLPVQAQEQEGGIAHPGHEGVFLLLGDRIPLRDGTVTSCLIERRSRVEDAFRMVAELKPITSARDITKGLERAAKQLPYPVAALALPADSLWQRARTGQRTALGAWAHDMPVLLATHLAWHDADAKRGERYQYRIIVPGEAPRHSTWVTAGGREPIAPVRPMTALYFERQGQLELSYMCMGMPRPTQFRLMRSDDQAPFEEVRPVVQARQQGDTLHYLLTDTSARRYRTFRYALHGWDRFGHAAPAIDTLHTASLDPTQMPMPTDLSAQGDSTGRAVRVQWRLPNAPLVKQLTLYRSTNSGTDFTPIAELASDRTEFMDEQVRPATSYFYYFVLEYKATHVPMRAPMFAASVLDPTPPDAPEELAIDHDGGPVRLQWTYPHANAHSFLVLRNDGDGAMQPVSGPMPALAEPHRYTWIDSTRLQPGRTYGYTVRTISTSHVHGPHSDTLRMVPQLPPPAPSAPRDLALQVDGSTLLLSWEDLSGEPFFLGYQLLRTRTIGGRNPQADTLIVHVNHFTDTVYHANAEHRYQVRTLSQLGPRSAFSTAVRGTGRFAAVPPPSQVHARRTGTGVEITWEAAPADDIVRYEVQRHVRGTEPATVGAETGSTLRLMDVKAPREPCFYQVRSVDADGRASSWSREVRVE